MSIPSESQETHQAHRIFGVFRAPETAAIWLILVLLVFFGTWSWIESRNAHRSKTEPIVKFVAKGDFEFHVEFQSPTKKFVSIYAVENGGVPEQIFPRLGKPSGLPWPLSADDNHRLPGGNESLRLPSLKPLRLFVLSHEESTPLLTEELWKEPLPTHSGKLKEVFYNVVFLNGAKKP